MSQVGRYTKPTRDQVLYVLERKTSIYPDTSRTLTAHDICTELGCSYTFIGSVAAILTHARKDLLAYRTPGPGTGGWCSGGGNPAVAEGWE